MGVTLERIFGDMPQVPFRDHVWPKFLYQNAARVLKINDVDRLGAVALTDEQQRAGRGGRQAIGPRALRPEADAVPGATDFETWRRRPRWSASSSSRVC